MSEYSAADLIVALAYLCKQTREPKSDPKKRCEVGRCVPCRAADEIEWLTTRIGELQDESRRSQNIHNADASRADATNRALWEKWAEIRRRKQTMNSTAFTGWLSRAVAAKDGEIERLREEVEWLRGDDHCQNSDNCALCAKLVEQIRVLRDLDGGEGEEKT